MLNRVSPLRFIYFTVDVSNEIFTLAATYQLAVAESTGSRTIPAAECAAHADAHTNTHDTHTQLTTLTDTSSIKPRLRFGHDRLITQKVNLRNKKFGYRMKCTNAQVKR